MFQILTESLRTRSDQRTLIRRYPVSGWHANFVVAMDWARMGVNDMVMTSKRVEIAALNTAAP